MQDEKAARTKVREGRADLAVKLIRNDYRIVAAVDNPFVQLAEQHVRTVYNRELQLQAAAAAAPDETQFREHVQSYLQMPPLRMLGVQLFDRHFANYGGIYDIPLWLRVRFR